MVAGAAEAAAKFLAWSMAQLGIEKPEELFKIILLLLFIPVAVLAIFFVLPMVAAVSVPLARPSQVQFYVDAASEVNAEYGLNIDWEEMLALDTVLLEQDFSKTSKSRAIALANDFVEVIRIVESHSYTDESGVERTSTSVRYEYRQYSLDDVMAMKGFSDEQKEWAYHFLSMGLSSLKDVGADMPEGWVPTPTGPFIWPVPESFRVTSKFGPRVCPVEGIDGIHNGLDIGAPRGTPIVSAADGKVSVAERRGNAGRAVIIVHSGGYETRYYHLNSIAVKKGQTLNQGDYIGGVGSTGKSTGNHLHFEIRRFTRALDPLSFF